MKEKINTTLEEDMNAFIASLEEFHKVIYESNKHRDVITILHHRILTWGVPIVTILLAFNITLFFILLSKGIL